MAEGFEVVSCGDTMGAEASDVRCEWALRYSAVVR